MDGHWIILTYAEDYSGLGFIIVKLEVKIQTVSTHAVSYNLNVDIKQNIFIVRVTLFKIHVRF